MSCWYLICGPLLGVGCGKGGGGGESGESMVHEISVTSCWSTNVSVYFLSIYVALLCYPKLSFCRGHTLHHHIHVSSEPFPAEKINIAMQVAQAMGYLHAKGIVHENLNTRNIFLEEDRVVITDVGLSNLKENIYVR